MQFKANKLVAYPRGSFFARGYGADTIEWDLEKNRKNVKYQEKKITVRKIKKSFLGAILKSLLGIC